jgi:hypothetical protein
MNDDFREKERSTVCVLCGAPWHPARNVCKCGGFATWGKEKGGPPDSFIVNEDGSWSLRPPPKKDEKNAD